MRQIHIFFRISNSWHCWFRRFVGVVNPNVKLFCLLFIKAMVKILNSKFGIVFFMKRCDETYMHLHMKWWFLIFSFHSLTTLCGSATTIAKPQRANNVKIVNFMTFYVMKLITALSLTFDWTVGETCIAFLKLFWEHLLIKKRTFWPYACFKTTHHIVQTGLEFHVWHYPLFLFHFLFKRGL